MYLTGLTGRQRLYEVATRWLCGRVQTDDARFLTEVFIYESLISGATVRAFVRRIIDTLRPGPLRYRQVFSKDEVRQALIDACREPTPRVAALFANYLENHEEFFPRTPVDMVLVTSADGALVALNRLKRIRRIADKASRRRVSAASPLSCSAAISVSRLSSEASAVASLASVSASDFRLALRSVSSEERNRISRDSLEVVVLPPTFTIDESTKTEYDEDFGNDYEGIVRNLLFSDEETQQSGVVYFKSVLNPDDSRIYDIAVGCSVECWEEFGEEMVEVVDSWLINTRQ